VNDTVLSDPIETNLAVIGGGLSGLTAGVTAAERGLSVHVFERGADERYPCNSRFAGGAFHVAYTDPTSDPSGLVDAINRVTKDEADPNLATVVAENAARTIYWLRDHGVDFSPGPTPMHKFMVTPHRPMLAGLDWPGHGPDEMIKTLTRKLLAAGGTLLRDAEALELLMDGEACKGMSVRIGEDDPIQVSAKSVLIADGGFQGNPNMVGKYIAKRPDLLVQRSAGTATGDGIRMAEAAGAELIFMERFYGHFLAREAMQREGFSPYPQLDQIAAAAIVVDNTGRRFVDEGLGGIYMSNVVSRFDNPAATFTIFDRDIWEKGPGVKSVYPANPTIERSGGTVYRAESPADLARQLEVNPGTLTETIESYNNCLQDGSRLAQGIPRSDHAVPAAPLDTSALLAIPLVVGITNTMGGIAIDATMRVKRPDGSTIDGLYAIGGSTGGLEGGGTIGYVGGLIKAALTGLIAGEAVAA
jgi:fumarate reductase flavoprotein subunit